MNSIKTPKNMKKIKKKNYKMMRKLKMKKYPIQEMNMENIRNLAIMQKGKSKIF